MALGVTAGARGRRGLGGIARCATVAACGKAGRAAVDSDRRERFGPGCPARRGDQGGTRERRRRGPRRPAFGRCGEVGGSGTGRRDSGSLPPARGRRAESTCRSWRRSGQAGTSSGRTEARGNSGERGAHQPMDGRGQSGRARPRAIGNLAQTRGRLAAGSRRSDAQVRSVARLAR